MIGRTCTIRSRPDCCAADSGKTDRKVLRPCVPAAICRTLGQCHTAEVIYIVCIDDPMF